MAASADLEPRAVAYGTLEGFADAVDVVTKGDVLMEYDEAARATVVFAFGELRSLVRRLTTR